MPFQLELARLKFDALNKYSLFQKVLFSEMNNRIKVDEHLFDLRAMWNDVYINSPEGMILNESILALNEYKKTIRVNSAQQIVSINIQST